MKPAIWFAIFALAPACFSDHPSSPPDAGSTGDSGGAGAGCNASSSGLGGGGAGQPPARLIVPRLGAGLVASVFYIAPMDHPAVTVASSDPHIVEGSVADPQTLGLAAHAAGTATLTTLDATTGEIVDSAQVTVVDVDQIAVRLFAAPGADQPITAAAGIAGSSDTVSVAFYAADGGLLTGTGKISVRGSGLSLPDDSPAVRFFPHGTPYLLGFGASGSAGELDIGLFDGDKQLAVPFDIVATADQLSIITYPLFQPEPSASTQIVVNALTASDIIGRTRDGRLVTGIIANWSTDPPDALALDIPGPTREQVFAVDTAGSFTLTAQVGDQAVSQQLTAQ